MFILFMFAFKACFAIETLEVNGSAGSRDSFWSLTQNQTSSDVFNKMTNVNFSTGGNRARFFQIRGVGERSQFDNLNQSPVGFFYEHIDLSEEPHAITSFNKNYSVHKKSQSVNYGSKAMGGIIHSSSCVAEECQENEFLLGLENYETSYGNYAQTIDWSESFSTQLNLHRRVSKGYQENQFLDTATGDQDEYYGEIHNRLEGNIIFESHHIFTHQDNGYDFFNINNDFISDSDRPGRENSRVHGHSLVFVKEWSNSELKSVSSYTQSKLNQSYDEDWGNNSFWNVVPGWNADYDYFSSNRFNKDKFHQKFILENEEYFLGFHYYFMDDAIDNVAFKGSQVRSKMKTKSRTQNLALYGGLNQKGNQWSFSESLRVENQERKLSGEALENYNRELMWALEMKISYQYSSGLQFYSNISKAFRGGGYNLEASLDDSRRSYEGEDLYLLELGLNQSKKKSFFDMKFFYMFRDQMQLRTSFQDDPTDPSSFSYYTDNASSAQNYGAEMDYFFNTSSWVFQASLAGLVSKFDDYKYANVDLSGRDTPYAPRYSFLVELGYHWDQNLKSSVSFYGQESFYFSNSHSQKSPPYQLVDFNVEYGLKSWKFLFWIRNLFDKKYTQRGFYFANEPPDWKSKLYTQPAPPRTFGMQVSYGF